MSTASPRSPHRTTALVAAALLVLLAVTAGLSLLNLGAWGLPVALAIAATKALFVAVFFMDLRAAPAVTRLAALAGLFWFGLLLAGVLADTLTRPL